MENTTKVNEPKLTVREIEILKLIANGYSNNNVGTVLNISPRTVSTHRNNIRRKLHVNNIAGLVRYALQNNLIK